MEDENKKIVDQIYPIRRTEMLCPMCMKKKLLQSSKTEAYCDNCGEEFFKEENSNSAEYKNKN